MTRKETPTVYVGGPLHGQVATRTGTKWSIYRDDNGQPLRTRKGDREMCGGTPPRRRYYAHQNYATGYGTAIGSAYVHATILSAWNDERHATPPELAV
jgi:hypothetical protein